VQDGDCERCGQAEHFFCVDSIGDILIYLCESRPWAKKKVALAHIAKAFDLHFILNRAIVLKWNFELIMKGLKIGCM